MNAPSSETTLHNLENVQIRNSHIPEAVTTALLQELFAVPSKRSYIPSGYGDIDIQSTEEYGLIVHIEASTFVQLCVKPILANATDGFISYNKRTAYVKQGDDSVVYMTVDPQNKNRFVYPRDIQVRTQTPLPAEAAYKAA